MPSVFIVDDDEDILDSLSIFFTKRNYIVTLFLSGANLPEEVNQKKPDLLLLDINLKSHDGRSICREIKETVKYPIKILLASANPMSLLSYEYNYADGIINKPFTLSELEGKCRKLLGLSKR